MCYFGYVYPLSLSIVVRKLIHELTIFLHGQCYIRHKLEIYLRRWDLK